MAPNCDLSDHRLLLLPAELFSVAAVRQIVTLNLRKNSLQFRPSNQVNLNCYKRKSNLNWQQ